MRQSQRWVAVVLWLAAAAGAEVYQHPNGFAVQVPDGWQVKQTDAGPSLVPPDPGQETHLLIAEGAHGFTRPDDPQIVAATDQQIRELLPFLQRREGTDAANAAATPGIGLTWAGRNDAGVSVLVRVYLTIVAGQVAHVISFGEQTAIERRDPAIRRIFATVSAGTPPPLAPPTGPAGPVAGDPFAGSFADDAVGLELAPAEGGYRGTLSVGGRTYPATATRQGDGLAGTFTVDGTAFTFTLSQQGAQVLLSSGGKTHALARRGAAGAAAPPATTAPSLTGGVPPLTRPEMPPEGALTPLHVDQRYEAGPRLSAPNCGVSWLLPKGYFGAVTKGTPAFAGTNGQGKLLVILPVVLGSQPPSLEQVVAEYFALLTSPMVVGKGATMQASGAPYRVGDVVGCGFVGQVGGGTLIAHAVGRVSPGTSNEALVLALGNPAVPDEVAGLAHAVAASLRFEAPPPEVKQWHQGLANKHLRIDSGWYSPQTGGGSIGGDSSTFLRLAADGRARWSYLSMLSVTPKQPTQYESPHPGDPLFTERPGARQSADFTEDRLGRWQVVGWLDGPRLVFVPTDNQKDADPKLYSLTVDGGVMVFNGKPVAAVWKLDG